MAGLLCLTKALRKPLKKPGAGIVPRIPDFHVQTMKQLPQPTLQRKIGVSQGAFQNEEPTQFSANGPRTDTTALKLSSKARYF